MHDARHLSTEELLLYSDGELTPDRAAHLAHCATCSAELSDLSGFLFHVEEELRAATPAARPAARSASWNRIENHIYAPEKHERRGFPVYWTAMYAAAAALTFAVLGGYMTSQFSFVEPVVDVAVALPAPSAPLPVRLDLGADVLAPVAPALSEQLPAAETERFTFTAGSSPIAPSEALTFASAPALDAPRPLVSTFDIPVARIDVRAPLTATEPAQSAPANPSVTAQEYWQLAQAGSWRDSITVTGRVSRPDNSAAISSAPLGGPAGPVRNSLVAHYSDAARRSFRSPSPALLEGEIQRFVSDVLDNQTSLIEHSYALHQALDAVGDTAKLDADGQKALRRLIDFHTRAMQQRESAIYARLSETLPRRIWSYRGEPSSAAGRGVGEAGKQVMSTVSGLDRELTAMLAGGTVTLDAETGARSAGAWLADLRTQLSDLRSRAKDLR